jgi:hypothetical protein
MRLAIAELLWRPNRQRSREALLPVHGNCGHLSKQFTGISFHRVLPNLKGQWCICIILSLLFQKGAALRNALQENGEGQKRSRIGPCGICVRLKNVDAITLGLVSVLRWGGTTTTLMGLLEKANLNHWILRTETDPVSEKLCFLVSGIPDDGQSPKIQ